MTRHTVRVTIGVKVEGEVARGKYRQATLVMARGRQAPLAMARGRHDPVMARGRQAPLMMARVLTKGIEVKLG